MSVDVLLGLQWGDEGKGKIVDYLAPQYNIVARFQGGPNAGHTLEFDNVKYVLHQVPSGIFRPQIKNIIGNGVVFDPVLFQEEIQGLIQLGVDPFQNLYISKKAHLILPSHKLLDAAQEKSKGNRKIGSTLKGIGPTYQDKIGRSGIRLGEMLNSEFRNKIDSIIKIHNIQLQNLGDKPVSGQSIEEFFQALAFLKKFYISDTEILINSEIDKGSSVLCEGAQGSMLDVDFGSYPFVTSSNTTVAGVCSGLGIPPTKIKKVIGVFKAYCTRVGSGPFPTELFDKTGDILRSKGNEFGATTGRPRRCGWLDLPALKYACVINGVNKLHMMKADVLSEFDEIKIATGYKTKEGEIASQLIYNIENTLDKPVYSDFAGWAFKDGDTKFTELPATFVDYINFIEENLDIPIEIISIGPRREETIIKPAVDLG